MKKTKKKERTAVILLVCILALGILPAMSAAETETDPVYSANKISVQDLQDGQEVIIYRTVYNAGTGKYEDYVIKGDGTLAKVFDKGDRLTGHCAESPVWKVIVHLNSSTGQPSGYYDFYNESTGMYLSPQSDGTIVSSTRPGVLLTGRQEGGYNSTIEKWDTATWSYYGYNVVPDATNGFKLQSGTGADSLAFSFGAYVSEDQPDQLVLIDTVDSKAAGITIRMFDYPDRATIYNITGSDSYQQGVLQKQHVEMILGEDGYPKFLNGNSGEPLFSPDGEYYKGEGNHLFLQSIYSATGYYEYQSFNNYAYYNQSTGDFSVYQQLGTPSNATNFYYNRGNFLPFNQLSLSTVSTNHNNFDGDGSPLDSMDPTNGGTLYLVSNVDFYFGMTVEASFMQPRQGQIDGDPVIYEFNGDDDLWVFIDGVLILDIGGVHDAFSGTINFATGEITGRNASTDASTIRECFKKAGVFPDGSEWDDSRADEYFTGNTFKDYGSHDFKMFYMEHGAGASNLEVRFNLPLIEKGRFAVEKKLTGTNQERFANVYFAYQAFKKDGENDIPLTEAVYENTTDPVTFYDNVTIGDETYDNVFYLKPGEAATFSGYYVNGEYTDFYDQDEYYVQEIGISTDYYDTVVINDVEVEGGEEVDGIYVAPVDTLARRARVTYANNCADKNLNELRVTKQLEEGSEDDGSTFEFRVQLENNESGDPYGSGELVPYSVGQYYIKRGDEYFYYVDGKLTSNGLTPIVASVSGQNGTIAGIPFGYTVVITKLLAGTDFHVEEIRLPADWALKDKEAVAGTFDPSTLTGTGFNGDPIEADGMIALDKDAEVIFTNTRPTAGIVITGKKVLTGRAMTEDEFSFTLIQVDASGEEIQGGASMSVTAVPDGTNSEASLVFGSLTFTLSDYTGAEYRDGDGNAVFYFAASEDIPSGVIDYYRDGITYTSDAFLVVVTLSWNDETKELSAEWRAYTYDGANIPDELKPAPTATPAPQGGG